MCPLLCVNREMLYIMGVLCVQCCVRTERYKENILLVSVSIGLYVMGDLCVYCCV